MRLRHVLLLMSGFGAGASLLLAANFHTQLKNAERYLLQGAPQPEAAAILAAGSAHLIGLAALAVIFLTMFLLLRSAIRDPGFAEQLEHAEPPPIEPPPAAEPAPEATRVARPSETGVGERGEQEAS
jgi:hypothetical protein